MSKYQLNMVLDNTLDEDIINYYINYNTKYIGDSGIDLICPNDITISQFNNASINFQIKCEMVNVLTNELVSYYLYPRSSISNTPLIMANSVGIIDSNYRGNIIAKVKYIPNNDLINYNIDKNTKLFQICAPDLGQIKLNIIQELTVTSRGNNGFGSSGTTI